MKTMNIEMRRSRCNEDVFYYLKTAGYFFNSKDRYLVHTSENKKIIKFIWDVEYFILGKLNEEYKLEGIDFDYLKAKRAMKIIINKLPKFTIKFERKEKIRRSINTTLEPVLKTLFLSLQSRNLPSNKQIYKYIYGYIDDLLEKKNKGKLKYRKLSYDEYHYLCNKYIFKYQYSDEFIHILRCVLRIQRNIENEELIKLEAEALCHWIRKENNKT